MKKLLPVFVSALLVFCLFGCGLTVTQIENTKPSETADVALSGDDVTENGLDEGSKPTENGKTGLDEGSTSGNKSALETVLTPTRSSNPPVTSVRLVEENTTAELASTTQAERDGHEALTDSKTDITEKDVRSDSTTYAEATETESTSETEATEKKVQCTVEISCKTILENYNSLKPSKVGFVPSSGVILAKTRLSVPQGSTAFDVIRLACEQNVCSDRCDYCKRHGIQMDYVYTPGFDSYYIRGVHQLYEKDCGSLSGWLYSVNGEFPNYGCNRYTVSNDDEIILMFTCDNL